MALAQGNKGETIRDAYHDTIGHRRYRQQGTTRFDTLLRRYNRVSLLPP
jgi:hypothetical protein